MKNILALLTFLIAITHGYSSDFSWGEKKQFFCVADFNTGSNLSWTIYTNKCIAKAKQTHNWKQDVHIISSTMQATNLSYMCVQVDNCQKAVSEQIVRTQNLIESYTEYGLPAPEIEQSVASFAGSQSTLIKYTFLD